MLQNHEHSTWAPIITSGSKMLQTDWGTRAVTSLSLFVLGGLIIQAQGWRGRSPPSLDPLTPSRVLCPSACCRVPSNFPTIWDVHNKNEIATDAELAITCALSALCHSLYYNWVPEIISVLMERQNSIPISGLKKSCGAVSGEPGPSITVQAGSALWTGTKTP